MPAENTHTRSKTKENMLRLAVRAGYDTLLNPAKGKYIVTKDGFHMYQWNPYKDLLQAYQALESFDNYEVSKNRVKGSTDIFYTITTGEPSLDWYSSEMNVPLPTAICEAILKDLKLADKIKEGKT